MDNEKKDGLEIENEREIVTKQKIVTEETRTEENTIKKRKKPEQDIMKEVLEMIDQQKIKTNQKEELSKLI